MVDVLLVKFEPEKELHGLPPPFGILFLGDALEKAGFKARLFHERATPAALARLLKEVEAEKPHFIGFSTISTSPLIMAQKASREIKKRFSLPVVWGGIHPTILPEQTLRNPFVDIVAMGEGEETIVELAQVLGGNRPDAETLSTVRGIGFKKDGRIILNEPRPYIKHLDAYSPAWHLLDIERYVFSRVNLFTKIGSKIAGDRIFALITSRGCPWRCGYCYNQVVNRRTFRAQSPGKVRAEVEKLKALGVSSLIFEDDNFFTDKKRALEIVHNLGLTWSCSIRADYIVKWGEDFVQELSDCGCAELRIGAESGSQRVLDMMRKDVTVGQIREAVAILAKHKISTPLGFMVGIPGETWEDVRQTLDFIDELDVVSPYVSVSSLSIYTPWPCTPLGDMAMARGFKPPLSVKRWTTAFNYRMSLAPFQDNRIKFLGFYRNMVWRDFNNVPFPYLARALQRLAAARWKARFFRWPLDFYIPEFVLRILRRTGLSKFVFTFFD